MNINKVVVTIEPAKYPQVNRPTYSMLRVKIERYPGDAVQLDMEIPDDDLHSMWDYIWETAGRTMKEEMEKAR